MRILSILKHQGTKLCIKAAKRATKWAQNIANWAADSVVFTVNGVPIESIPTFATWAGSWLPMMTIYRLFSWISGKLVNIGAKYPVFWPMTVRQPTLWDISIRQLFKLSSCMASKLGFHLSICVNFLPLSIIAVPITLHVSPFASYLMVLGWLPALLLFWRNVACSP